MIQYIIFIVIYLAGCIANYYLNKYEHKDQHRFEKDSNLLDVAIDVIFTPFYILDELVSIFFILSSWVGTFIYSIYIITDKIENYYKKKEKKKADAEKEQDKKIRLRIMNGIAEEIYVKLIKTLAKGKSKNYYRFDTFKNPVGDIVLYSIQYRNPHSLDILNDTFKQIVDELIKTEPLAKCARLTEFGAIGFNDRQIIPVRFISCDTPGSWEPELNKILDERVANIKILEK